MPLSLNPSVSDLSSKREKIPPLIAEPKLPAKPRKVARRAVTMKWVLGRERCRRWERV
jgi:hypothetical protein